MAPPIGARTCSDAMMRRCRSRRTTPCRASAARWRRRPGAAIRSPSTFFSSSRTCSSALATAQSRSSRRRCAGRISLPCSSSRARWQRLASPRRARSAPTRRGAAAPPRSARSRIPPASARTVSSRSVRCCVVGSKVDDDVAGGRPSRRSRRGPRSADPIRLEGAVRTTERTGRISPRSCRKSTNVVRRDERGRQRRRAAGRGETPRRSAHRQRDDGATTPAPIAGAFLHRRSSATSIAAARSGIRCGSVPSMLKTARNVRTRFDIVLIAPICDSCSSRPSKARAG